MGNSGFDSLASSYSVRSARAPWSMVRALEWRALGRMMPVPDPGTEELLELGAGTGHYSRLLAARGFLPFAVDSSRAMVEQLRAGGIPCAQAAVETLSLGRSYSWILAAGLLEFLPDPAALFRSSARHASKDTRLVLLYPRSGFLGHCYERWQSARGTPARAHSGSLLRRLAEEEGWHWEAGAGAGPLARVMRWRRDERR